MQTSTQTKPLTIQEWKGIAQAAEQANEAAQKKAEEKQAQFKAALVAFIRSDLPLGEFLQGIYPRDSDDWYATFRVPDHADIKAMYHQDYDGECRQTTLDRSSGSPRDKYAVSVYAGVSKERDADGDGEYYANYEWRNRFIELGDALLFAERNYTDPAVIEAEVAAANANPLDHAVNALMDEMVKPATPKTLTESLVAVLQDLIDERVDNKLGRHEYDYHQQ